MDLIKKYFRRSLIIVFTILAGFGIGLAGGMAILPKLRKAQDKYEDLIEVVELKEDSEEMDGDTFEIS